MYLRDLVCLAVSIVPSFFAPPVCGQSLARSAFPISDPVSQNRLSSATQEIWPRATQPVSTAQLVEPLSSKPVDEADPLQAARAQILRAQALEQLGKKDEAIVAWQGAARACEHAGDEPGRVEALIKAGLLLVPDKPKEGDVLLGQALFLAQRDLKPPLAVAQALDAAGRAYYALRRFATAQQFWAAAVNIEQEVIPDSLGLASTLNELGDSARRQDDLDSAEHAYSQALAIREKLAPDSLGMAESLNNLGNVAIGRGDLARAEQYYKRAFVLRHELAPNSFVASESLHKLGDVAIQQGDLVAAEEYYRQALALRRRLGNLRDVAGSLNGLGNIARAQGDMAKAERYYRESLGIVETVAPGSLDEARALNNLGNVAAMEGDLAKAAQYYEQVLVLREKHVPGSLMVAESLGNLGNIALQQENLAKAEQYHKESLALKEQQSPNSLLVADTLNDLGNLSRTQSDWAKAAQYYRQALDLREKLAPNSLAVAQSLFSLSEVALQEGNRTEAEQRASAAWDLVRQQATIVTGDEARQAFDISTARYAAQLMRCQLALNDTRSAFATLEQSRAQSLQQLIADRHLIARLLEDKQESGYQSAVALRDRRQASLSMASAAEARARQELAKRTDEHASPERIAQDENNLRSAVADREEAQSAYTQARLKADELWADIRKNAPRAFAPPLAFEQAETIVPQGALFLAFSVDEDRTYLFLLRAQTNDRPARSLSVYTIDLSRKHLAQLVEKFHNHAARPLWGAAGVMLGRELYAELFPAAVQQEIANSTRLLISPDGPLWDVPFAALVVNRSGWPRYLSEEKPITYATSLTLFAQSRNDIPQLDDGLSVRALVVGHPAFESGVPEDAGQTAGNSSTGRGYDGHPARLWTKHAPGALPYSRQEAIEVAKLYRTDLLMDRAATEEAVRRQIETADVIHFAAHSLSLPLAMSSGILLAPPEQMPADGETNNDGVLQAWEIQSQLKLRAELVVLSSCESGRGEVVPQEGLVGLTRALQYAGARSIVASQWKVNDRSTSKLMVAFHRYLRQGLAKDEALRQAMANVRRHPGTARPYYWAAFFLLGDPDNPNLGRKGQL